MNSLFHPTYLPSIHQMGAMLQAESIDFEGFDSFQKQTYRNRAYIYAANGKLQLNIPVRYSQKNRQYYKDVEIAYDENWQLIHQRSIESAYSASPFFEFYQDELMPLYDKKEKFLYDFNLKSIELLFDALQMPFEYNTTDKFEENTDYYRDFRSLVNSKSKSTLKLKSYFQVFADKYGFIENLSTIDLICNLGPESSIYLKNIQLVSD